MESGAFAPKSKCSIFHILKYMIFQRHQKALSWSKGLKENNSFGYFEYDTKIDTIINVGHHDLYFLKQYCINDLCKVSVKK